ncbi:unnamed protein product, partial [Symbiodinium sp. CCMP2456]
MRYIAWADRQVIAAFPFSEENLCAFACECEGKCAPSFLKSLMSSISFCFHILGAGSAQEATNSKRLVGVAKACYLTKRKRFQRPPLTTEMVLRLERLVVSSSGDNVDRFIAGFFLLSVYMRGRYSDTQNMCNIFEDRPSPDPTGLGGYLQADVARHGLSDEDWFTAWSQVRKDLKVIGLVTRLVRRWRQAGSAASLGDRKLEFAPDNTRSGYFPTVDDVDAGYDVEGSGSEASLDEEEDEADCE